MSADRLIAWLASISDPDWCLIGIVVVLLYITVCDVIAARRERTGSGR